MACSTVTLDQSAPSSSAAMAARPAWFPWPNSMCLEMTVTVPSLANFRNGPKAPKSLSAPQLITPICWAGVQPTRRPAPVRVAETVRKPRRLRGWFIRLRLHRLRRDGRGRGRRGVLDRRADALVGAAAADVAVHGRGDRRVVRVRGVG